MTLLDQLIETIGHTATLDLVRGWGGRRAYIPKNPRPDHPITLRIGQDAANALARCCGGHTLELPAQRNVLVRLRDQAIVQSLDKGASPGEVATDHGLSERHVRHIRDVQSRRET